MLKNVIVPVDLFSPTAVAVRVAAALARRGSLDVQLVLVASPKLDHREDEEDLQRLAAEIDAPHVRTDIVESNDVARALVETAGSDGLLCLETRAQPALRAAIVGSTSEDVLRVATRPLLLIGPSTDGDLVPNAMLVCVDDPDAAAVLVPVAAEWARTFGMAVHVVHVWEHKGWFRHVGDAQDELAGIVHRLHEQHGIDASWEILSGDGVAQAVVRNADQLGASTISVAARHRTGLRARVLGHVAVEIAHDTRGAVLAVPLAGAVLPHG